MFIKAIEVADKFTRAIHFIHREYGSDKVVPGSATLFFINNEGWALTCKHVANHIISAQKINDNWTRFQAELRKAEHTKKKKKAIDDLKKRYGYKSGVAIQLKSRLMACANGFKSLEVFMHKEDDIDLALIKVNSDQLLITQFARFPKDTSSLQQGKFLCRLGYPFPEFTNFAYNPGSDEIEWTESGHTATPRFPIEGMVTRHLARKGANGVEIYGFEMSTPGLRGQSGGPAFDKDGIVWGVQFATDHLYLANHVNHQIAETV